MTSKLIPENPEEVMVIRDVVPNTITTCSVPFARFGRIKVGGRGTIVRLQDNTLAIFSPVALTPAVKSKIDSLGGNVAYIAAPDIEHHIFLGPYHQAYPSASILAPEGLPEKRDQQKDEKVPFTHIYTPTTPSPSISPAFDAEFQSLYVPAHQNKEIAFLHKPTKTLIQADLLFNYPSTEQYSKTGQSATSGILTKIFGALTSVQGKGQKRAIWYGISSGDRVGFSKSVSQIEGWDFDRIIPCHGDVIETGGKGIFRSVMEWHLELAKKNP